MGGWNGTGQSKVNTWDGERPRKESMEKKRGDRVQEKGDKMRSNLSNLCLCETRSVEWRVVQMWGWLRSRGKKSVQTKGCV